MYYENEMDDEDRTELVTTLMFEGNVTYEDMKNDSDGKITAMSGVVFDITTDDSNHMVTLTSTTGGSISFNSDDASTGSNGTVYTADDVKTNE